jgi:CheY-like chemotaxis protein
MPEPLPIVLLVEDDENDALLAQRAMREARTAHRIIRMESGEKAVAYLRGDPPYSDRTEHPLPSLVLLDLKMPGLTGFDVLTWLQTQPELSTKVPVVVLTGSVHPEDMDKAKKLGAVGFEVKPVDFSQLVSIAKNLSQIRDNRATP